MAVVACHITPSSTPLTTPTPLIHSTPTPFPPSDSKRSGESVRWWEGESREKEGKCCRLVAMGKVWRNTECGQNDVVLRGWRDGMLRVGQCSHLPLSWWSFFLYLFSLLSCFPASYFFFINCHNFPFSLFLSLYCRIFPLSPYLILILSFTILLFLLYS